MAYGCRVAEGQRGDRKELSRGSNPDKLRTNLKHCRCVSPSAARVGESDLSACACGHESRLDSTAHAALSVRGEKLLRKHACSIYGRGERWRQQGGAISRGSNQHLNSHSRLRQPHVPFEIPRYTRHARCSLLNLTTAELMQCRVVTYGLPQQMRSKRSASRAVLDLVLPRSTQLYFTYIGPV